LGANGHQVPVVDGFAAVLTRFLHLKEIDKRSQALKYKAFSHTGVSFLSQRFFDALGESPTFLAL
jgi:hypothetical protein